MRFRSLFTDRSSRAKRVGAAVAAGGLILVGIVANPVGAAHAESSCTLKSEHQANSDRFECHFVHFEVKGNVDLFGRVNPGWTGEVDFFSDSEGKNVVDYWKTNDSRPGTQTWTWDCAKDSEQKGEWPCTWYYKVHLSNSSDNNNVLDTEIQPLNTNHCFTIRFSGTEDNGTSPEGCNTN